MAIWDLKEVYKKERANESGRGSGKFLWAGGSVPGESDTISSIHITTLGNASDFGNLTVSKKSMGAASNNSRVLWYFR